VEFNLDNQTKQSIDLDFLKQIASEVTTKNIELVVCTNKYIQLLNKEFRKIDKPTDVLSFPLEEMEHFPLGSIVISIDFVKEKAKEFNHKEDEELALLFIHGLLHLAGYDHEIDDGEHRQKEEELIKKFNLPDSLIIRTKG